MPLLRTGTGALVRYATVGTGQKHVLLLAPGGMRSCIEQWEKQPLDLRKELEGEYTVTAMDQRNATKESTAPMTPVANWGTYVEDQIAVMDEVAGPESKWAVAGSCIGPSYALRMMRDHGSRVTCGVLLQPIGVAAATTEREPWEGLNTAVSTSHWFYDWAHEMEADNRAERPALDALYSSLFESHGGDPFVFSVSRDDVRRISQPLLVTCGLDVFHPAQTARDLAELAPHATLVERWRGSPAEIQGARLAVADFLRAHA